MDSQGVSSHRSKAKAYCTHCWEIVCAFFRNYLCCCFFNGKKVKSDRRHSSDISVGHRNVVSSAEHSSAGVAGNDSNNQPRTVLLWGTLLQFNLPKGQSGRTPIFYTMGVSANEPELATVNAGSHDGHIGGGGLNKAFGDLEPFFHRSDRMAAFKADLKQHLSGMNSGEENIQVVDLSTAIYAMRQVVLLQCHGVRGNNAGSVAVYEYDEKPNGVDKNSVMVYVFPPKRQNYSNEADFLEAVKLTASNIIAAYNYYAEMMMQAGRQVPVLRMNAFSSDRYSGGVPKDRVVKSIVSGVKEKCEGLHQNGMLKISVIQFSASFDYLLDSMLSGD